MYDMGLFENMGCHETPTNKEHGNLNAEDTLGIALLGPSMFRHSDFEVEGHALLHSNSRAQQQTVAATLDHESVEQTLVVQSQAFEQTQVAVSDHESADQMQMVESQACEQHTRAGHGN